MPNYIPEFHFRLAEKGESPNLVEIQIAALQKNSLPFYAKHEIECWVSALDSGEYEQAITGGEVYVATYEKSIVGFGQYKKEWREIKELYIDPSFGMRGLGRSIASILEGMARKLDVKSLRTFSTLNAVPFYQKLFFKVIGEKQLEIATNTFITFVEMEKSLVR